MNISKSVDGIERDFPEDKITELFEKTKSENAKDLEDFITSCKTQGSTDTLQHRWDKIREMIFHLDQRIHYWENRRTQFLQIGLGILGASLAGITAIFANIKELSDVFLITTNSYDSFIPTAKGLVYMFIFLLCICFAFGSLKLIYLWNRQNNPNYPFTKGYRIWLWHYRHAEKTPSDTRISGYTQQTFRQEVDKFCRNIVDYKRRFLQSSINDMIDQDLSQAYLLLVNEKYKIKMVNALRNILINTLTIAFLVALTIAVLFAIARYHML
jgi:hypothetical protein